MHDAYFQKLLSHLIDRINGIEHIIHEKDIKSYGHSKIDLKNLNNMVDIALYIKNNRNIYEPVFLE